MNHWPIQMLIYTPGDGAELIGMPDSVLSNQLRRLEAVATNPAICAVAQLESTSGPSLRWLLGAPGRAIEPFAQTISGSANELVDFVRWAAQSWPAECHVLVVSGQGVSWRDDRTQTGLRSVGLLPGAPAPIAPVRHHPRHLFGAAPRGEARAILIDEAMLKGYVSRLPNAELGVALERSSGVIGKRFATVAFDSCEAASLELLAELADTASTAVCPIGAVSAGALDLHDTAIALGAFGVPTPRECAAAIVTTFQPNSPWDAIVAFDVDSPAFTKALEGFGAFSFNLLKWLRAEEDRADTLRREIQAVEPETLLDGNLLDLGRLAEAVSGIEGMPANVKSAIKAVVENVRAATIASNPIDLPDERLGVAIYWPGSAEQYRYDRPEFGRLRFTAVTRWDKVLDAAFL